MGFRFRKSINVGGFRVTVSKSGIGYSFGFPGFRATKTATGRNRTTVSLPGTGISWVTETSGKKTGPRTKGEQINKSCNETLLYSTELTPEDYVPSESEALLKALRKYKSSQQIIKIFALIFLALALFSSDHWWGIGTSVMVALSIYFYFYKRVNIVFDMDEHATQYQQKLDAFLSLLENNEKLYESKQVFQAHNIKYNAGASKSVSTHDVRLLKISPPFMKTDIKCFRLKTSRGNMYFLPNGIMINRFSELYFLDMKDLVAKFDMTIFIESFTPEDSELVGYTWQYVNRGGGPDRRFNNNPQFNRNRYGEIYLSIGDTFKLKLMFSNFRQKEALESAFNDFKRAS